MYSHVTKSALVEVNYFGHPRGIKSKYRLASEFALHLLWLATDEKLDEKNCKCVKCSPQGSKSKEKTAETVTTPSDQGPRSNKISSASQSPAPTQASSAPATTSAQPQNPPRGTSSTLSQLQSFHSEPTPQPSQPQTARPSDSQNVQQMRSQGVFSPLPQGTLPPQGNTTSNSAAKSVQSTAIQNSQRPQGQNIHPYQTPTSATPQPPQNLRTVAETTTFQPTNLGFPALDGYEDATNDFNFNFNMGTIDPHLNPTLDQSLGLDQPFQQMNEIVTPMADSNSMMGFGRPRSRSHGPSFDPNIKSPPQNLQQLYDITMMHYYRPGELVWIDRFPNDDSRPPVLALITGRSTSFALPGEPDRTYEVMFLGANNPLDEQGRAEVTTNHEDGKILPFLALPAPEIKDRALLQALGSGNINEHDWKLFQYSPDARIALCAQRVDRSYLLDTKLPIQGTYSFQDRNFDLYKSLWFGAERIWPGDVLRVRSFNNVMNTKSNDVMVVTHIKETWENNYRDHSVVHFPGDSPTDPDPNEPPAPSILSVVGDIWELQQVPNHPFTTQTSLPEPLHNELKRMNSEFAGRGGRPGYRRVLKNRHFPLPLTSVLGRWYPFSILFELYDEKLERDVLQRRSIDPPFASQFLFPRGKCIVPGQDGRDGLGRRLTGFDLLESYRAAVPQTTRLRPYEGSVYDPQDTGLPMCDDQAFGFDFGEKPMDWTGTGVA